MSVEVLTKMAHVFFFGYAHENLNNHLTEFFEDLCKHLSEAISSDPASGQVVSWAAQDPNISFRDGKDLALMDNWRPAILNALQSSSVLVSVTSPAYFQKKFCGQEYFIFDHRRQQGIAGGLAPEVILPVIWIPITQKLPFIREIQLDTGLMSPLYREKGLKYLKIFQPREYEKCVWQFGEAIKHAWTAHPSIPPLKNVLPFDQIPNAFAGGVWDEAITSGGWILGPGVVNFVFAAGVDSELNSPAGRYGGKAAEWRPYLPPEPRTIEEIARAAATKHSLRYREIVIDQQLSNELDGTRNRKNLTLVLADPQTLALAILKYQPLKSFDGHTWAGTSLMILWDGVISPLIQQTISQTFPIKSVLKPPLYRPQIGTADDLDKLLDITLAELRASMTQTETKDKDKTDDAPAQISGTLGPPQ
jgi:hypothetical protein